MLICLDYDGTYHADPELWSVFITACQSRGHEVILATYRDDRYDQTPLLEELAGRIPVYYTRGVAKKWWMEQFAPIEHAKPSIWVDDRPEAILNNSGYARDSLEEWRQKDAIRQTQVGG